MNIQQLLRRKNTPVTYFEIPHTNLGGIKNSGAFDRQIAESGTAYVEVRVKEIFLRDQRVVHREFNPLCLAYCRLIFDGDWRDVPYIIGPGLLNDIQQIEHGDQITFLNLRVAGPYPYLGDNIDLFIGLMRVTTNDWARGMVNMAEQIVKSFPLGVLSAYSTVIPAVISGVQNILAMQDEAELLLGQYRSYENLHQGRRYFALIRSVNDLPPQEEFWVQDDRLWQGKGQPQALFTASDFILFSIEALPKREDWTTLDFHKRLWKPIPALIQGGQLKKAEQQFNALCVELALCPDIIEAHRIQMMSGYRSALEREWQIKQSQQAAMPWNQVQEFRQSQNAYLKSVADQHQFAPATHSALDMTEQLINDTLNGPIALAGDDPVETVVEHALASQVVEAKDLNLDPLEFASLLGTDVSMGFSEPKA